VKPAEIRELSSDEIREQIAQVREELFRLKFRSATQQLESPALVRSLRRDLARMHTVLREREMASHG
jgi:large subunit ribosomal protein L29